MSFVQKKEEKNIGLQARRKDLCTAWGASTIIYLQKCLDLQFHARYFSWKKSSGRAWARTYRFEDIQSRSSLLYLRMGKLTLSGFRNICPIRWLLQGTGYPFQARSGF